MGDFEIDTRLEETAPGLFRAVLSPEWQIWGPSGGHVASIALSAAGLGANVPGPTSFAGHFVSVAQLFCLPVRDS